MCPSEPVSPAPPPASSPSPRELLSEIHGDIQGTYSRNRRVLSFDEYFALLCADPARHARSAAQYLKDVFDHFGVEELRTPRGVVRRFRLFDCPWEGGRDHLVGQEEVQGRVYRAIANFVREGRVNKLILLHGPNGSAKSTFVACIMRALEDYSTLDQGALYRYSWVFPSTKTVRGALGFGQEKGQGDKLASYAHLPDDQIDAKLLLEVRDHPLFLIPVAERRQLLEKILPKGAEPPPDWILRGEQSHKSQQVFEALLSSYKGSYQEVLKHVQVERYFVSQRYRVGAVTIGPQMSVDAAERQVTADRSLSALPPSLQAVSLYEAKGELVDAAGGVLEFSDLLKRPLDTFKYLQLSIETGEVALVAQNVQLNCVMVGSANELHLDAFREHPEFPSFRGRIELLRTPYLRSFLDEQALYDSQIAPQVQRHVAPHATEVAALFAVLTRMRKPNTDKFGRVLSSALSGLTAVEKVDLYATGKAPERLDSDQQKVLRASVAEVYTESDSYPIYEGRIGASPREMRVVLFDAAQSDRYQCLSPLAVLDELERLCQRRSEFEWLQQDVVSGGYHDVKLFRESILERMLGIWEQEVYAASGLVEEERYDELFERYVQHVSVWVKRERIRNKITGDYEEPDEKMMREVERLLDVKGDADEARKQMISGIAAWAIDHPQQKVEAVNVFPQHLRRMREVIFSEKRGEVGKIARDIVILVRDEGSGLDAGRRQQASEAIERLIGRYGYCRSCAADVSSMLLRKRFTEVV